MTLLIFICLTSHSARVLFSSSTWLRVLVVLALFNIGSPKILWIIIFFIWIGYSKHNFPLHTWLRINLIHSILNSWGICKMYVKPLVSKCWCLCFNTPFTHNFSWVSSISRVPRSCIKQKKFEQISLMSITLGGIYDLALFGSSPFTIARLSLMYGAFQLIHQTNILDYFLVLLLEDAMLGRVCRNTKTFNKKYIDHLEAHKLLFANRSQKFMISNEFDFLPFKKFSLLKCDKCLVFFLIRW